MMNSDAPAFPLLLSVPHSGRQYPDAVLAMARLPVERLAALEDRYCDRLIDGCVAAGFPVLVAEVARAVVDLNRGQSDMDIDAVVPIDRMRFAVPGRKARAGLGIVPTRLAHGGMIWKALLTGDAIAGRIAQYYAPYHAAVSAHLGAIYGRFGQALLVDVHSMPSLPSGRGARRVDMVVGDGFGATAPAWIADTIGAVARDAGLNVAVNAPYPGGHIVRAHTRPAQRIFGVQIEFDRALYLDGQGRCAARGTARINAMLADTASALVQEMGQRDGVNPWPLAAE